ncbi:hypothetical protein BDW62DRAFT_199348 [Aspergillus aurantiobrunneus]
MTSQSPLRVGILTSGAHPVQTIYLPALHALPTLYTIVAIHTSSQPKSQSTSPSPSDILASPTINLILNFMPNEYHELYTIAALQAGKHVMVETPVSLSIPSAKRILDAERDAPNGARVFVASARRYAPCFESVFKAEVSRLNRIHYARLRMIAGPHAAHTATATSRTDARRNGFTESDEKVHVDGNDERATTSNPEAEEEEEEADEADRITRLHALMEEIFGKEQPNPERMALSCFLHWAATISASCATPWDTRTRSLFHYNGNAGRGAGHGDHPFTLVYETGTDAVPRCDAQLAVYGQSKTVTIHYDLPYARGQPVRVVVERADERGALMQTETVSTWEEVYQEELKALYAYLVEGKEARTTARDSLQDIKLFQMIFQQYDRQCGTIRTPLG